MRHIGLSTLLIFAAPLWAQNEKEMLRLLQRDVAQLQESSRALNSKLDEKIAVMTTLLQQALEESRSASRTAAILDNRLRESLKEQQAMLKEQQGSIAGPSATLAAKIEQMDQDVSAMKESVSDSSQRLTKLQAAVADLILTIKTANAPKPEPPSTDRPPSSQDILDAALRDRQGGNVDLALKQLQDLIRLFPSSPLVPDAQFYIGDIFYNKGDYITAIQAFDDALADTDNKKRPDILYMKGMALIKSERRSQAGQVFAEVIKKYPASEAAAKAKERRRDLGLPAIPPASKKRD